jgi:hypothetical protein
MTSNNETDSKSKKLTVPVNIGSDHIRGSIDAPIAKSFIMLHLELAYSLFS